MAKKGSILRECALGKDLIHEAQAMVQAIAAGSAGESPVFKAPFDAVLVSAGFIPESAITGADVNYMTLSLEDKKAGATIGSKSYTLGNDVAQFAYEELKKGYEIAKDAVVTFKKAEVGTGMAMPRLLVVIVYKPRH